jgi:hypothetical protein
MMCIRWSRRRGEKKKVGEANIKAPFGGLEAASSGENEQKNSSKSRVDVEIVVVLILKPFRVSVTFMKFYELYR